MMMRNTLCSGVPVSSVGRGVYLSLEVKQPQGFELDGGFGAEVSSQGTREVLQFLDTMCDAGLQSEREREGMWGQRACLGCGVRGHA